MTPAGLPHSGIRGSGLTCSSPRLFAAYRAFRRLGTPRHPPYALGSLTFSGYLRKPQSPACTHLRTSGVLRVSGGTLPLRYHIAMMSMLVIFMTLNPKMSVKPFCLHYLLGGALIHSVLRLHASALSSRRQQILSVALLRLRFVS